MPQETPEKLRCMAGILAARELVSAKRGGIFGGDEMLTKRFDPHKLGPRAAIIEGNLRLMYQEDQLRLFNLAKEGHGGEMMESYRKENNYNNHMTSLYLFAKTGKLDVAAAMAIREGYICSPRRSRSSFWTIKSSCSAPLPNAPGRQKAAVCTSDSYTFCGKARGGRPRVHVTRSLPPRAFAAKSYCFFAA